MAYRCPNDRAPLVAGGTVQFCPQCHGVFDPDVLAVAAKAAAERELPKASQVFVRRTEELAALWRVYTAACEQRIPQVVLLRGPAGIGKTAILERFYQQIASSQIWDPDDYWPDVPAGRLDQISERERADEWSERSDRVPLFMWFAARCNQIRSDLHGAEEDDHDASGARELDAWAHLLESTDVHREVGKGRWRSWLPSAGELFKEVALEGVGSFIPGAGLIAAAAGAVADRMRGRDKKLEEALSSLDETAARVFARMADVDEDGLPVILAFDDLQWADDKSLETTLQVLERARGKPLVIVATVRSVDVKAESRPLLQLMDQLERRRGEELGYTVVDVDRLGEESVVEQLRLLLGTSADTEVVRWIASKADGMPLFADELARLAIAEELLDNAGQLTDGRSIDDFDAAWADGGLPNDVRGVIGERLRRLRDRDWRQHSLIAYGAVEGRRFRDRLLERVTRGLADFADVDLAAIRRRLDDAEKTHDVIQAEDSQLLPNGDHVLPYVYTHGLLHDAFLRSLRDDERIRCLEALLEMHAADRDSADTSGTRFDRIARAVAHDLVWRQLVELRSLTVDECAESFHIAAEVADLKHGAESHESTYSALAHAHDVAKRWATNAPDSRDGRAAELQITTEAADVLREMGHFAEALRHLQSAADVAFELHAEARADGSADEALILRDRAASVLGKLRAVVDEIGSRSDLAQLAMRYSMLVDRCCDDADANAWQVPFTAAMLRGELAFEHEGTASGKAAWTAGWRLLSPMVDQIASLDDGSFYALASAYHELFERFTGCDEHDICSEVAEELAVATATRVAHNGGPDASRLHAATMYVMSEVHQHANDRDAELRVLREAVDINRAIAEAETSFDEIVPGQGVVVAQWTLASALSRQGLAFEAVDAIDEALHTARSLEQRHPTQSVYDAVDTALSYAATIAASIGDTARARELLEERIRNNRRHAGRFGSEQFRDNLLYSYSALIRLLIAIGDSWAARRAVSERISLARQYDKAAGGFARRRQLISALMQAAPFLLELGDSDEARRLAREALDHSEALVAESPSFTDCDQLDTAMYTYADVLSGIGERKHALTIAIERLAQNRRWMVVYGRRVFEHNELYAATQLALLHAQVGELAVARDVLTDARKAAAGLVDDVGDQASSSTLHNILDRLADVLCELGDFEGAVLLYEERVRRAEGAAQDRYIGAEVLLGGALFSLGDYHRLHDSDEKALACFTRMMEQLSPAWEAGDRTPAVRNLVWGHYWLASTAHQQGEHASACSQIAEATAIAAELVEQLADVESYEALARVLELSGDIHRDSGNRDQCLSDLASATELRERLASDIGSRQARMAAADAQIQLSGAHYDTDAPDLALAALDRAERHRIELCDEASDNAEAVAGLANVYWERARLEADLEHFAAAREYGGRALQHIDRAAQIGGLIQRRHLRAMLDNIAGLAALIGLDDEVLDLRRREVEVAKSIADEAGDLTSRRCSVDALAVLAGALAENNKRAAAGDALVECLERARALDATNDTPSLLCDALDLLADHRIEDGDDKGALTLLAKEASRFSERGLADPSVRRALGRIQLRIADLQSSLGDDRGLAATHSHLLAMVRAAAESNDDVWSLTEEVTTICAVADRHFDAGRHELSRAVYAETLELGRCLAEECGTRGDAVVVTALHSLAIEHQRHGELDEALAAYREVIERYAALGEFSNDYGTVNALEALADVHRRRGDGEAALSACRTCIDHARTLADAEPGAESAIALQIAQLWHGDLLMDMGQRDESAALLGELAEAGGEIGGPAMTLLADLHELWDAPALSLPLRERAVKAATGEEPRVRARALARRAETLRRAGDPAGAAKIAHEAATVVRNAPGTVTTNRTVNNAITESILFMCQSSAPASDSLSLPREEIVEMWDTVPATDLIRAWERDLRARFDAHDQNT